MSHLRGLEMAPCPVLLQHRGTKTYPGPNLILDPGQDSSRSNGWDLALPHPLDLSLHLRFGLANCLCKITLHLQPIHRVRSSLILSSALPFHASHPSPSPPAVPLTALVSCFDCFSFVCIQRLVISVCAGIGSTLFVACNYGLPCLSCAIAFAAGPLRAGSTTPLIQTD
ncbi:uncharacterized protein EI90DRAFT_1963438 [Cantharellus anzutake]|uniref:uncharacterized protein n=1 Tax=Cantharellus anzutake TaxID=1750568 RepID=UPI001904C9EC|nr:uncharacterized protein EI90DRAFT_1963438 [Cantharellus anzutake]KAF8307651.1 hypothetical protein EI90DRAFT_1963438 [Cantharellus anzutake]